MSSSKGKIVIRNWKAKTRVCCSPRKKLVFLRDNRLGLVGISLPSSYPLVIMLIIVLGAPCHLHRGFLRHWKGDRLRFQGCSHRWFRVLDISSGEASRVSDDRVALLEHKFAEVVVFSKEEIKTATNPWKYTLVGRFLGHGLPIDL